MGSPEFSVNKHLNRSVHFYQAIPNSHYWTDLNQLITNYNTNSDELTVRYLVVGLKNAIKNGYKIKRLSEANSKNSPVFASIDDMLKYVEGVSGDEKIPYTFIQIISNSILSGLNLTNGRKMERREVYQRLDGERNYQDEKWGTRREADGTPDEEKPVAEWINYMEFHLQKAKNAVYYLNTQDALEELRKVTALGVRAMEIHGCPARQIEAGDGTKPTGIDKPCSCTDCDCEK